MKDWRKIKSGAEWGLFYGIITWLAFTALTNHIPALGIWGMIVSRIVIGVLSAWLIWDKAWWLRGLVWGVAGHVPFALLALIPLGGAYRSFFFGWHQGWVLMLVTGLIIGVLVELSMRHYDKQEAKASSN